ncbi:MAG: 4Fe-4S dicluster domain-containing protein [Vicinamibacterales bacterium]|nr:4Fe-4S dicluster domain-containing protein [Vicinamibacterales bacterium]
MSGPGFVLDLHRCVGCSACVIACRIENGRAYAAAWRRVLPLNLARRPGGPTYSLSVACHHCDDPACLRGCPASAYEKRADGVVLHHDDRCIGCRYCEMSCPFGAPQFDADRGVVSKCHLCAPRLDAGLEPACVTACPTGALLSAPDARPKPDATTSNAAAANTTRANTTHVFTGAGVSRLEDTHSCVPGFVDPAGCGPHLRFRLPAGARRTVLYRALEEALRR